MEDPKSTIEKIFLTGGNSNGDRVNRWHYENGPTGIQTKPDVHLPPYMTFPTLVHSAVPRGLASRMGEASEMSRNGAEMARYVRRGSTSSTSSSDDEPMAKVEGSAPRARRASTGSNDTDINSQKNDLFSRFMEMSHLQGQMSMEEFLRMRNEQRCFFCGTRGHLALSCPERKLNK